LFALTLTGLIKILSGNYDGALAQSEEAESVGAEKDAVLRRAQGKIQRGCVYSLTGKAAEAAEIIASGLVEFQATGATYFVPFYLSCLARAQAQLRQFDSARRAISNAIAAIETTGEHWWESEVHRVAGEIELMLPSPDRAKAESDFNHALAVAVKQRAKSWELRAATSLARLWRGEGKTWQARELLAPVHGWFTEGFETLDLREARSLLSELAS
jgi:predicted ATPase